MSESAEQGLRALQEFPARNLEKQTIIALNDKVIVESKTIFHEYAVEYDYSKLSPKVVRGKSGDSAWSNIAWYFIAASFVVGILLRLLFIGMIPQNIFIILAIGLLAFAALAFALRFVKYDQVWFYEKDDTFGFTVLLSGSNRKDREDMVNYIIDKIKRADLKS